MWQSCSPGFPYPTALHLGALSQIKSLALSAHVSPRTIHFQVLDKRPVLGPGRGSPFLQQNDSHQSMEQNSIQKYSYTEMVFTDFST